MVINADPLPHGGPVIYHTERRLVFLPPADPCPWFAHLYALALEGPVVYDIETTGLDRERDRIVQIAAVRGITTSHPTTFMRWIDVGRPLSVEVAALLQVEPETPQRLGGAESEVMAAFTRFVGPSPVAGHNVLDFDHAFVNAALERAGVPQRMDAERTIDTLPLARVLLAEWTADGRRVRNMISVPDFTLATLVDYYGLHDGEALHDALSDARMTARLARLLLGMARQRCDHAVDVAS